jgi:uncharacterized protein (TIGR03086 family)
VFIASTAEDEGDRMPESRHKAPRPDLAPATTVVAEVVRGIPDEHLDRSTPCPGTSVAAMLDHLAGLTAAFTAAGRHQPVPGGDRPPSADASRLDPGFRESIPAALASLAEAWREPEAWTGTVRVGGVDLPGQVAGLVALDEVVVHGWDLASATDQPYAPPAAAVDGALGFVEPTVTENPGGTPGLFGPRVDLPDDASPFDRLLGLTGRDPRWRPGAATGHRAG